MAAMAAILDFWSAWFLLFLIYKSTQCFLASLESTGLSVQEKKGKIDFQDGGHGGHLGFPIGTILAIFDLQVTSMLPTNYRVNWFLFDFGFNVAFNNLSVILWRCLDVTGSSMLTFRVLPHWNIMPQTLWHDIPPSHIILTLNWPVPIPSSTFLMLSA